MEDDCLKSIAEIKWSDNGNNFYGIHIQIMKFKGWLRGIHQHCSKNHMQGYLDEYCFRYNRRNNLDTIFHKIVERMVIGIKSTKISATEVG
ncbi:MAG: transposase [Salinivirgaceae bacterium]|nr:transposase [Salinivirgaceae bacterium]